MAFRHDSTLMPSSGGPVSRAIAAVEREHEPHRRLVLAALAAIPLIPRPDFGAEPVTQTLLTAYCDFLLMERRRLLAEMYPDPAVRAALRNNCLGSAGASAFHIPFDGKGGSAPPSTRAAAVLDAVGCDWR